MKSLLLMTKGEVQYSPLNTILCKTHCSSLSLSLFLNVVAHILHNRGREEQLFILFVCVDFQIVIFSLTSTFQRRTWRLFIMKIKWKWNCVSIQWYVTLDLKDKTHRQFLYNCSLFITTVKTFHLMKCCAFWWNINHVW